eukprot:5081486-Amphidinium_carterae.1
MQVVNDQLSKDGTPCSVRAVPSRNCPKIVDNLIEPAAYAIMASIPAWHGRVRVALDQVRAFRPGSSYHTQLMSTMST